MDRVLTSIFVGVVAVTVVSAAPRIRVARDTGAALRLGLPSNATSIRASEMISERFSCMGRHYGYYADPDNDCQLFHVCLPVQFDDGRNSMYKWSFVCPEDTIFNQETFTCSRKEDAIACQDSERFYNLNEDLGRQKPQPGQESDTVDMESVSAEAQHQYQHGMDRPMEMRPADSADNVRENPTLIPDTSDEISNKYGAFTTIRY